MTRYARSGERGSQRPHGPNPIASPALGRRRALPPDRVADVLVTGLLVAGALVLELGRALADAGETIRVGWWLAENVRVRPVGRRRQSSR